MQFKSLTNVLILTLCGIVFGVFSNETLACNFKNVQFKADFSGARLDNCKRNSDTDYVLTIDAENRPINNSPWYAFKVKSKNTQRVSLSIDVVQGSQRYLPKISSDGKDWQPIAYHIADGILQFSMEVNERPTWVSAQELFTSEDFTIWLNKMSKSKKVKHIQLGNSPQGKPINGLEIAQPSNNEWLVLIGRQHPPEITGTLAMLAFAEQLLATSSLNQDFLQRFNLLIIPLLNPDGVDAGNWRHNSQGVDLNRDWGKFTQIETQLVGIKLDSITQSGGKIVFALDFHSTQRDVFYTMPNDYDLAPQLFVDQWLEDLKSNVLSSFVVRNVPGTSPGRGVFKQFIADTYQVHAVTYEMGDNTPRTMINSVASSAAKTLMHKMLSTPTDSFHVTAREEKSAKQE